jgi:hypothetical protein
MNKASCGGQLTQSILVYRYFKTSVMATKFYPHNTLMSKSSIETGLVSFVEIKPVAQHYQDAFIHQTHST